MIGVSGLINQDTQILGDLIQQIRDQQMTTMDTVCLERARLVTQAYSR